MARLLNFKDLPAVVHGVCFLDLCLSYNVSSTNGHIEDITNITSSFRHLLTELELSWTAPQLHFVNFPRYFWPDSPRWISKPDTDTSAGFPGTRKEARED